MSGASVAAKRAEIAMRYRCMNRAARRKRAESLSPIRMTSLRTAELERFFRDLFGGLFPNTWEGVDALVVMAEQHLQRNRPEIVSSWLRARAPWVSDRMAAAVVSRAQQRTSRQTASQLGWRIKLTAEVRKRLKITTIRAVGQTDTSMAEDRRQAARDRKEKERRAAGATPRAQYEAESLSQTRPWERFGISRRTWERRGKPMPESFDASPSAPKKEKNTAEDALASHREVAVADRHQGDEGKSLTPAIARFRPPMVSAAESRPRFDHQARPHEDGHSPGQGSRSLGSICAEILAGFRIVDRRPT